MERYFGMPVAGGDGIPTLVASAAAGHPPAIARS
jgi:diacylglycerol kinase family enzyme